jgi:aspartyl-tRNA(Asn)/glutamyl-tRNA(Gln) amidotransferase subunit A
VSTPTHHEAVARLDASSLIDCFRTGALSPVEATTALLERTDRVNPSLNAIVTVTRDLALERAAEAEDRYRRGDTAGRPLLGVPFTVKDNILTKGVRTTMGSLLTRDLVPAVDAPPVERSHRAGAILLGKTNTPEYGWKGETSNRVFGTTRNPWDLRRTPGGSSGGGAAAVAAGLCPLAIGTDGGGSIRIPAAFCGIVGFKGSFGLIPVVPNGTLETLPHVGVLTRTVRDAALFVSVLAGPDPRDRLSLNPTGIDFVGAVDRGVDGLRIGWSADLGFATPEEDVLAIAAGAARAFEEAGATVDGVDAAGLDDPYDVFALFFSAAMAAPHVDDFDAVRDRLDPGRARIAEAAFDRSAPELAAALVARHRWHERMLELMEGYDVLLTPTMPIPPFRVGLDRPETVAGRPVTGLAWSPYTYPLNLTGQPACSVPCGVTADGLPVGLQIIGRWRGDEAVLRAAAAFERLRPWHDRRPPEATEAPGD